MFRIIKWLVIVAVVAAIVMWVTGLRVKGKTIQDYLAPVTQSKIVKEGMKDIRSIVGEGLKSAGEAISEDVTDAERKQLDNVLKEELKKGKPIEGAPGQKALPPQMKPKPEPEKAMLINEREAAKAQGASNDSIEKKVESIIKEATQQQLAPPPQTEIPAPAGQPKK